MQKHARSIKRILLLFLVLAPISMVCYVCGSIGLGYFQLLVWYPAQMRQAIKQYSGSTYLFEENDGIMTNTEQATVYYWSADPIETVKASYEKTGLTFIAGTKINDWWITAYNKNAQSQTLATSTEGVNGPQSICTEPLQFNWSSWLTENETENARLSTEKAKEFGCISITLVDANHPSLCTLKAVFPGYQGNAVTRTPPYENCARFPKQGTLIIFNYYLESM